MLEPKNLTTC